MYLQAVNLPVHSFSVRKIKMRIKTTILIIISIMIIIIIIIIIKINNIHFIENQSVNTKVIKNIKIFYFNYNDKFIIHLH